MTVKVLLKMIQKFENAGSFDVQSGRERKRIDSTVVEEVHTAVQEESSGGVKLCSAWELPEHWTELGARCIEFYETSWIAILTKLAICWSCFILTCQQERLSFRIFCSHGSRHKWSWKILWKSEAHFHLTRYVITQTCRICVTGNPLETQPIPLHPANGTVWCGFTASFIIGPYFFREDRCFRSCYCYHNWSALLMFFTQPRHCNSTITLMCGSNQFYARWRSSAHCKPSEAAVEAAFWFICHLYSNPFKFGCLQRHLLLKFGFFSCNMFSPFFNNTSFKFCVFLICGSILQRSEILTFVELTLLF